MLNATIDKAILKCYCELYNNSTPKADFNKLIKTAKTNSLGQKIIPFKKYQIEEDKFNEILENTIKEFKIKGMYKQQFKTTIYLGCSPKFKN